MNTFIPQHFQAAQQQYMAQYSPQYAMYYQKSYFNPLKSQRNSFSHLQQQQKGQTGRVQVQMQTTEGHQSPPEKQENQALSSFGRQNRVSYKNSSSFQNKSNRKVFHKQTFQQQKQLVEHESSPISEQQNSQDYNVKNRSQELEDKDNFNRNYLQIPKNTGSLNESRKSSFDYSSDVSTQLCESEYAEVSTVEKNSSSKKNQKAKQLREKKVEFEDSYDAATVKRPKKFFRNDYERDNFIKNYQMKYKTEMCKNWELWGKCKFEKTCSFAHGEHELQKKTHLPSNYKTKLCQQFHTTSYCPYGNRCQFLHSQFDIFAQKELSYESILAESARLTQERTISLKNGVESQYLNVFQTKRLPIFKSLDQTANSKPKQ